MKRLFMCFLCVVMMVFVFAGCNSANNDTSQPQIKAEAFDYTDWLAEYKDVYRMQEGDVVRDAQTALKIGDAAILSYVGQEHWDASKWNQAEVFYDETNKIWCVSRYGYEETNKDTVEYFLDGDVHCMIDATNGEILGVYVW